MDLLELLADDRPGLPGKRLWRLRHPVATKRLRHEAVGVHETIVVGNDPTLLKHMRLVVQHIEVVEVAIDELLERERELVGQLMLLGLHADKVVRIALASLEPFDPLTGEVLVQTGRGLDLRARDVHEHLLVEFLTAELEDLAAACAVETPLGVGDQLV